MSKGSKQRPQTVADAVVAENWARTFAKNPDNTGINKNEYYDVLTTEEALTEQNMQWFREYDDKITRNNSETQALYNAELDSGTHYN
jgi:hypothetical protein